MAQPRVYTQSTNFTDHSTTNPSDPHSGANLDTEFVEVKQNLDDLNTNIALLQRDDGKLINEAVHKDAFDQDALTLIGLKGFTVRGAWAAATAYASGDIITNNDSTYLTTTAHTSSSAFSTDTAKWTLLANAAINVTGHSVDTLNGLGPQSLQGASWSSGAAVITFTSDVGTPAVGMHITHSGFPTGTKIQSVDSGTQVTADTNSTAAGTGQVVELSSGFTLTYSYGSSTDFQVYIANQLVAPSTYTVSGTTITFTTPPAAGTGNIIVWGGGVAVEATKSQVTSYRDDTLDHRDTTIDYAIRTAGVVRHFDGATNNVTDTTPTDQSGVYSAKEWAVGTQASTGGSAKDWAIKDDGGVSGSTSDHSAKAWAVGGTGVTDTASKGAAKEWAIETSGNVDGTSFSAKEYAQGTQASTGGSAKDYAQKTDGGVSGATSDHSSKAWAIGGTGVTTTASKGAAKEWATTTGGAVDTSEYSAKEYAIGTTVAAGSAKDWAIQAKDSVVDGGTGYSALHWAAKAEDTYDNFDDRFLGAHTTAEREVGSGNIGKDHDGDALVSGALYFDTTLGVMKVWNGSLWKQLTPTTAEQTNIDTIVTGYDGTATTSGTTTNLSLINTVKLNLEDVNNFATRYRVGDSDPIDSKDDGDLFWNRSSDELKIYNSTASAWQVPYLDSASVNAEATNAAISMAIALG